MRLRLFFFLISFLFVSFSTFAKKEIALGSWQGKLRLKDQTELPFRIVLSKGKEQPLLQIRNGEEKIDLLFVTKEFDTLTYQFPQFDSQIKFVFLNNKSLKGYWWNKNKKGRYTLPLTGHFCENDLFECQKVYGSIEETLAPKWKTQFAPGTSDAWPAIGLFDKNGEDLTGTFLTETGDYRFLSGNMYGEDLFLSCFDGSHAFLFTAKKQADSLIGTFYSGNHYSCAWSAVEDAAYELPNPNEITYVVNDSPLAFHFKEVGASEFNYPNKTFENKVTIIQIMGSWCPNCMDETRYYQDLYTKYHDKGLEIILIGYEAGSDEAEYEEKLKRFRERNKIPFTMLVGGAANKNKAAEDFSMLNHIISFPTSIFVDKTGKITKVHTGFNGPSTGQYYNEYMKETEAFLMELLGL